MNPIFKTFLRLSSGLYRISNGKIMGHMAGLNVLLLSTIGRKSRRVRTTPLGFFEYDQDYVITASNAGADKNPSWFLNLSDNPNVHIRIGHKEMPATAQVVKADLRKELWAQLVSLSPGYAQYANATQREIPMILLHPASS